MNKKLIIDENGRRATFVDEEKEFSIPITKAHLYVNAENWKSEYEVTLEFLADEVEITKN